MKLHSQGPKYYAEAEAAYETLFQSEVFSYPESLSFAKQIDLYGDAEDLHDATEGADPGATVLPTVGADDAPNTLHQILFLAFKNRGQYLLDKLKEQLKHAEPDSRGKEELFSSQAVRNTVIASLEYFVEAADRDEADLQLWRLMSKLSLFLGGKRLARYCLEAVFDTEDSEADQSLDLLNLEESFAAEQLKSLVRMIDDDVSEAQMSIVSNKNSVLLNSLRKHVDPCPFLPTPFKKRSHVNTSLAPQDVAIHRRDIPVAMRTWASVGMAILLQISNAAQGAADLAFGTAYRIVLPDPASSRQGIGRLVTPLSIETAVGSLPTRISLAQSNAEQCSSAKTIDGSGEVISPMFVAETSNPKDTSTSIDSIKVETSKIFDDSKNSSIQAARAKTGAEPDEQEIAASGTSEVPNVPNVESPRTMSLPTRKRSTEAAGLPEPTDSGRSKSKRIKARESAPEAAAEDLTRYYEDQLHDYTQADRWLFELVGKILTKLDVNNLRTYDELRNAFSSSTTTARGDLETKDMMAVAIQDMKNVLMSWSPEKSTALLRKVDAKNDFGGANGARNFTAYLENSKRGSPHSSDMPRMPDDEGLEDLISDINQNWTHLDQLSLRWLQGLLAPKLPISEAGDNAASAYERFIWTPSLKETVVKVLVGKDGFIYRSLLEEAQALDDRLVDPQVASSTGSWECQDEQLVRLIQNLFELHLDIYERITNPNSEVDVETRTMQRDRLGRWAALTYNVISQRPENGPDRDELRIRFLWSSVLYVNLTDATARDHVILCFQDLKRILFTAQIQFIKLPNNAAMPEISQEAADREISSLTTMDFFLGIFSSENNEPLAVIESLEPILQRSIENKMPLSRDDGGHSHSSNNRSSFVSTEEWEHSMPAVGSPVDEIVRYLDKASLTLRLFLWQRLGTAYESINYVPQVVSCNLRRIELIVEHLHTSNYSSQPTVVRQPSLLGWLSDLEHLISTTLGLVTKQSNAFEFVGMAQLQSSMATMSALQQIVHVYILWQDSVRVGQNTVTQPLRGSAATAFGHSMAKFDHMQLRMWMLQFFLIKEAIVQAPELFESPKEDLVDYLNLVHYSLGLRELCGLCEKSFLKLMKTELLQHKMSESWESDYAQVIWDLYGIKICPGYQSIRNHGCTPVVLDRKTALELMDYVLVQANRMSIKDLAKSELKSTIDRMQEAIKPPKPSNATSFNKRAMAHFLKSPINPLDMYRAFQGIGELSSILIINEFSAIADKGWYSLFGQMALARFRAQKRTIPGPLDDLDLASQYLKFDLELGIEKWETWYRLAQTYDTRIEENTTWTAVKIYTGMEELKALQRGAIHCYTMAVATAARSADASFETVGKMADMYSDFAIRIYASSREPFSMKAFRLEDFERHFSNPDQGMYKKRPFRDLQLYPAWDFASYLLRRSLTDKADNWM